MRTSCRRAGVLLERRSAGLLDADALRLEEHLADCARCREEARILDSILLADAAGRPGRAPGSAIRALRRALDQATAAQAPPVARRLSSRPLRFGLALAGAAAAAGLAALWMGGGASTSRTAASDPGQVTPEVAIPPTAPATLDRIEVGMVTSDGVSLAAGDPVVSARPLIVEREARLALAHARVNAATGSAIEWNAGERTLRVHTGSVRVAVDPVPRRLVRVVTDRFAVEVLGTEFAVDPGGVEVTSGKVRIVDPDRAVLVDSLGAGQAWRIDVEPPPERDEQAAGSARTGGESVREVLARARAFIADGDPVSARRASRSVLARRPVSADAAEARTLLAECALLEGNRDLAIRLYLDVADRHRKLPAGETALFLAARIADDGRHGRAATLLRRYLDTHPSGRFHVEATRRLTRLDGR